MGIGKHEQRFIRYPKTAYVIGPYLAADLPSFADFDRIKTQVDSVRKTYVSLGKPLVVAFTNPSRHGHEIGLFLRDTILLTSQSKARLADLGSFHGLPKIELPNGVIEHMDVLLESYPELFRHYAMRDAEIAVKHAYEMAKLNQQWTGEIAVPITLGGMALQFTKRCWIEAGVDIKRIAGVTVQERQFYNQRRGQCRTKKIQVHVPGYVENEALAAESYHGGRNEAFVYGPTSAGDFRCFDLKRAYSMVLFGLPMPDFDNARHSTNPQDFRAETLGFARVKFGFPPKIRFPVMPVRTDHGLIFPLRGESYCTAQEIAAALQVGAAIEIQNGVVIPTDKSVRPFEEVLTRLTRQQSAGEEFVAAMCKEMSNSLYGKTAQGIREKRVFNTRTGRPELVPTSSLTNPFIAAYTSGYIRALLAEILNDIPAERTVVSITTDGFITDANETEIQEAIKGPLGTLFAIWRQELSDKPEVLGVKDRASQLLVWRTRGQATAVPGVDGKPILAKGGLQAPKG